MQLAQFTNSTTLPLPTLECFSGRKTSCGVFCHTGLHHQPFLGTIPYHPFFRLNIFHQKAITHRAYSTDTRLILLSLMSSLLHQRINIRAAHCIIPTAHHIIGCTYTALCCGPSNHLIYASLISLLWLSMPYALCKHMQTPFIYKYST
jgi:hypothetical protein